MNSPGSISKKTFLKGGALVNVPYSVIPIRDIAVLFCTDDNCCFQPGDNGQPI